MHAQAHRCAVSSALRHAWLCSFTQRMDLPNSFSVDLAGDGSDADLHADFGGTRLVAAAKGLFFYKPAPGTLLLFTVSGNRLVGSLLRFHSGKERAVAVTLVAVPATLLLPAGDVLRHDQIRCSSDPWRHRGLGENRA